MSERIGVRVEHAPSRCPYCHEDLGGADEVVACRDCGARHHAPCWGEDRKCATCRSERVLGAPVATVAAPQEDAPVASAPPAVTTVTEETLVWLSLPLLAWMGVGIIAWAQEPVAAGALLVLAVLLTVWTWRRLRSPPPPAVKPKGE